MQYRFYILNRPNPKSYPDLGSAVNAIPQDREVMVAEANDLGVFTPQAWAILPRKPGTDRRIRDMEPSYIQGRSVSDFSP